MDQALKLLKQKVANAGLPSPFLTEFVTDRRSVEQCGFGKPVPTAYNGGTHLRFEKDAEFVKFITEELGGTNYAVSHSNHAVSIFFKVK